MSIEHPPSTQMERRLAGYWSEWLGLQVATLREQWVQEQAEAGR
ncbi:hypothetical protein KYC5002_30005 [Archangium violaceum]|nr:hypothetical protein KYC5002_30005 [Archangium gephyra]